MATQTSNVVIKGKAYNKNDTFTAAVAGTWYGSSDGTNGSGTIPKGCTVTFLGYMNDYSWQKVHYIVKSSSFNGNYECWTSDAIFPDNTSYTITYNANGGSGAPGNQTKIYNQNLTLSSTIPTKSNTTASGYTVTFNGNGGTPSKTTATATDTTKYTFANWKDGAGTTYSAGGTYTKNQNDTLTAQWSSSVTKGSVTTATATKSNGTATRTVTLNANGGTCSTASLNSTATITYSCNGWYTAASGGTKRASSGGSYTPSASETVYAQWGSSTGTYSAITLPSATKANTSATARTVTFDATTNGGSCSTTSLNSTASISYALNGWYTAATGGTLRGKGGASYTPSAAETLYAQFGSTTGAYSSVTLPNATRASTTASRVVTFNANGGVCNTSTLTSTATVSYSLSGWFTASSGGTSRGKSGSTYVPSASEKLYAQFASSTGAYSSITLPTPTKDGYIFKGWSTSSTASSGSTGSYTPSGTQTLYAIWTKDVKGNMYIKINGQWTLASKILTKINGVWK